MISKNKIFQYIAIALLASASQLITTKMTIEETKKDIKKEYEKSCKEEES